MNPAASPTDSLLRSLRRAAPRGPIGHAAGIRLAERQAYLLRRSLGISEAAFPDEAFSQISFAVTHATAGLAVSGMSTRLDDGRFDIAVRADEPPVRQRFSLAHELKHAIDWDSPDYRFAAGLDSGARIERICDRFAAALLMPAPLVRQDWYRGRREPAALARRYDVSIATAEHRLRDLGLVSPTPRCTHPKGGSH